MRHLRGWMVVGAMVLFCAGAIWLAAYRRSRLIDTPATLLSRLPAKDSVILSIDFVALRQAGLVDLLQNSRTPEEPDYQQFVGRTDFDYKQDLDLAVASFGPTGKYFLLRGRFNWGNLSAYAKSESGSCYNTLCQMPGSAPERKISFVPLQARLMALAVSKNPMAAGEMMKRVKDGRQITGSNDPVWITFPGSVVSQWSDLPAGTQFFAQTLQPAEEVVLSLGPKGQDFQVTLGAQCRSEKDAVLLQRELARRTEMARALIARENRTPTPRDLAFVLTSGEFAHTGGHVYGHWPIARQFVVDTLSGEAR